MVFLFQVDGVTIKDSPEILLQHGDFVKADIMIGNKTLY